MLVLIFLLFQTDEKAAVFPGADLHSREVWARETFEMFPGAHGMLVLPSFTVGSLNQPHPLSPGLTRIDRQQNACDA